MGGLWWPSWEHFGLLGRIFGASWKHVGGILEPGPREEAPRGPEEAPRGPQVEAQEGPEGPKMHSRKVKDDIGNENYESLKNHHILNENA